MAAKIDLKKTSRIRLTADGYTAERIAIVSGVSGTAAEVLFNAINDAALPDIGDAHPDISTITLNDISCEPFSGGTFKITMSYYKDSGTTQTSSSAEARAVAGLSVEETHVDINGQPLKTQYKTAWGGAIVRQPFTAEVERPRMSFEFEYTTTGFPTSDTAKYLGKINSTNWNGYPPKTILCGSINVDQNGDNFRVRYSFAYRAETWKFVGKAVYSPPLNPHPVEPDTALDLVTGVREFDVYRTVDFSPLGFTLTAITYPLVANAGSIILTGHDATLTVA